MPALIPAAVGLILTAFVLLQQLAWWQRKEYRFDRLRAEAALRARSPRVWLAGAALAGLAALGLIMPSAGWLGLVVIGAGYVYQTWRRGVFKPKPTRKALVIGAAAVALVAALIWSGQSLLLPAALDWYVVVLLTPALTAVAVLLGNLVGDRQKRRIIEQAKQRRQTMANLVVVGITGSYGKTSTKYFLHHLMSGDGRVLMSAQRRNEAFAVAQDMERRLTSDTTAYIVEMGAYRRGEIEALTRLARPSIGVVTAIRNQHLALFGSLAAIAAAKWELIAGLPPDGTAVLNADDSTIVAEAQNHTGRIVWYSLKKPADVWADGISYEPTSSAFTLHIGQSKQPVTISLPGEGAVAAAVAAVAAAHAAGVPPARIFERLASLPSVPQTMAVTANSRGSTIIDDSYSANEDGVLMAIRHLQRFPHAKKVVVLRPLIELGEETARVHTAIGQALAAADARVYLYDTPGAADIARAARAAGLQQPIHRVAAPAALAEALTSILDPETACLLENRLPALVRQTALA